MRKTLVCLIVLLWAAGVAAQQFDADAEQQLLELVNQERAREGLPALKPDARLTKAARQHSVELAGHRQLSHQFPGEPGLRQRLAAAGLRFDRSAENVGFDTDGVRSAHEGLMNSPPHRANILSPRYGSIGIGAVWSGHALYVTQDFANVLDELSVDDLETAIQRQLGKPPEVRPHDARLRQIACSMAEHKRLNPDELLRAFPKARNAFAFTISDPERLPAGLQAMRTAPRSGYALGACFVRDDSTPEGVFWVAAVFF